MFDSTVPDQIVISIKDTTPMRAINPNPKQKINESLMKWNLVGLGNRIALTSKPFVVEYPVQVTIALAVLVAQVFTTSVPENRVYFLSLLES